MFTVDFNKLLSSAFEHRDFVYFINNREKITRELKHTHGLFEILSKVQLDSCDFIRTVQLHCGDIFSFAWVHERVSQNQITAQCTQQWQFYHSRQSVIKEVSKKCSLNMMQRWFFLRQQLTAQAHIHKKSRKLKTSKMYGLLRKPSCCVNCLHGNLRLVVNVLPDWNCC